MLIAAKAVALREAATDEFKDYQRQTDGQRLSARPLSGATRLPDRRGWNR